MDSITVSGSTDNTNEWTIVQMICPKCHKPYGGLMPNDHDSTAVLEFCNCPPEPIHISSPFGYGWICPKCGAVYSPTMTECSRCSPPPKITCGDGVDFTGGSYGT